MFEISRHVHNPGNISFTAKNVATNGLFALLLIFLIVFPVQLVNDTLIVHHDEIQYRLRHFREATAGGVMGAVMHPGGSSFGLIGGMALLAGVIYGFLDPGFGFDQASIAFVVGLAISFLVIVLAWELPHMWWTHTHTERSVALRVFPAVIPIAIVCVLLSRATGLHPGFVFGITAGTVAVAGEATREHEGRSAALGAATLFGVVLVAWLLWWPVGNAAGDAAHPSFLLLVLDSVLVGTVIAGLQWMVFGLVPMTFLRGGSLFRYSKILWAFLIGLACVHPPLPGPAPRRRALRQPPAGGLVVDPVRGAGRRLDRVLGVLPAPPRAGSQRVGGRR